MTIEIDNRDFCIRLYNDVVYFKALGHHGHSEANFFAKMVDEMLIGFNGEQFASLCNFEDMVLSEPKVALRINHSIKEIANAFNYKCNAIVIKPKFFEIMKAYMFSFYLKNINVKTKIFYSNEEAIKWIEELGFNLKEIKDFLNKDKDDTE